MKRVAVSERTLIPQDTSRCWVWIGAVNNSGYGYIGRSLAHRRQYTDMIGPIPEGTVIDHLCENKLCVNPEHLQAVTQKENQIRNSHNVIRETCKRGHLLSDDNVYSNGQGRNGAKARTCKICTLARRQRKHGRVV